MSKLSVPLATALWLTGALVLSGCSLSGPEAPPEPEGDYLPLNSALIAHHEEELLAKDRERYRQELAMRHQAAAQLTVSQTRSRSQVRTKQGKAVIKAQAQHRPGSQAQNDAGTSAKIKSQPQPAKEQPHV